MGSRVKPPRWRLQPALAHPRVATAAALCVGLGLSAWLALAPSLPAIQTTSVAPTAAPVPDEVADSPTAVPTVDATAAESPFAGIDQAPPTPPARTGLTTYEVQPGDVLWQIAERFGLRTETLLWANDLPNPDLILVGQKLTIPPVDGVMYTVRPDDNLADIAQRYGVDANAIVAANKLPSPDQLVAGVDIFLPGGRPLPPAARAPDTAQAPDGQQQAALAAPPIPLPANIDDILGAGWLKTTETTTLYKTADQGSKQLDDLPAGAQIERLEGFSGGRIQVRDAGDGRTRQAMTGWIDADALDVGRAPSPRQLPLGYPADTAMDIAQVFAPYRSQLDGSPYALANCGPTSLGMALAAFGVDVPPSQLRQEVLNAQHMWGNNAGTVMPALAAVAQQHGLKTLDMYDADGSISHWTLDDIRGDIAAGHPVVVQVRYRSLPGRANIPYFQDHYILVTGVVPDGFLYNDPIDVDGLGWDRFMTGDQLYAAMNATDRRYAYAGFAVSS